LTVGWGEQAKLTNFDETFREDVLSSTVRSTWRTRPVGIRNFVWKRFKKEASMSEKAQRNAWETRPMPGKTAQLPYACVFSLEEYEKISVGLIPQQMEDKWFIFLEDEWLYLHRSWTGNCIYKVQLLQKEDKYIVTSVLVNRDPEQYGETDINYDAALLNFLIANFLLGRQVPFPVPSNLPKDTPEGVYQHHISGSGYPEVEFKKEK
jgi:hypothetical protein